MTNFASSVLQRLGQVHGFYVDSSGVKLDAKSCGYWSHMEHMERLMVDRGLFFSSPPVLARSATLWVSDEMVRLLKHARASLPPYVFDPAALPWTNALVFAGSSLFAHTTPETTTDVVGMQWAHVYDRYWGFAGWSHGDKGLFCRIVGALEKGDDLAAAAMVSVGSDGRVREGNSLHGGVSPVAPSAADTIARTLCTMWLLLRQRVAVRRVERPERAARRRFERGGHEVPEQITVIELRRPLQSGAGDGAPSSPVDWSHRWIVDGHWRNQFHPSTGGHVPTWIAPYVKGPDERPLVVKDRVHAWVR